MDHDFWQRRWHKNDIGFHRDDVHVLLARYWADLNVAEGATVFVPLCGKSHDMIWLAEQGYKVVGVELSPIAIAAFFSEQNLTPQTRPEGEFTVYSQGPYEIWCGDAFALPNKILEQVSAVYDRASLVALPEDLQTKFAELIAQKLSANAPIFLITLDYDPSEISGPPFNISHDRIADLFQATHTISFVRSHNAMDEHIGLRDRGLTALQESLHVLKRKA